MRLYVIDSVKMIIELSTHISFFRFDNLNAVILVNYYVNMSFLIFLCFVCCVNLHL